MQKIIDYEILYEYPSNTFVTGGTLTEKVQKLIKSGWQPWGQPFVAPHEVCGELKTACTAQAMVRYAENKAADKTANKTETKID